MQMVAVMCLRGLNGITSERLILSFPTCSEVCDRPFCSFAHFNVLFDCGFLSVVNMKNSLTVQNTYTETDKWTEKQDGREMNINNA